VPVSVSVIYPKWVAPMAEEGNDKRPMTPCRPDRGPLGIASCPVHPSPSVMAHIHEKIDFTVAIFVVHEHRVLLIHHRKLDKWLPLGGHIELDEDPEQAALREAREESGLDVELSGERPPTTEPGTRALVAPRFLDIHRITDTHEHIGMIYWARPKQGALALAVEEHHDIRWVSAGELDSLTPPVSGAVKWYCRKAIEEMRSAECETRNGWGSA